MRTTRILAAAGLFVALAPFPASSTVATETVTIPGNYFSPQTARVYVGDRVVWFNDTSRNHTVISSSDSSESFRSNGNCGILAGNDCLRPGRSFAHTFDERGTFTYYCRIHGSDATYPNCGMCGRVVVVTRKAQPTTPPTSPGTSASPTATASASPSGTASVFPTGTASTPPGANDPGDDDSTTSTLALAAVGVALLGGAGFVVYRTMIRR
jgi:plastocyanin